jgi:hypothetical protein
MALRFPLASMIILLTLLGRPALSGETQGDSSINHLVDDGGMVRPPEHL